MLYRSKARIVWIILAVIVALAAAVLAIINLINNQAIYLTIATFLAMLFFVFRGISEFIESKYAARKDRKYIRTISYIYFGCGVFCLIVFIIQLITSL